MIPWYQVNFADEDPSGFAAARRGHLMKPEKSSKNLAADRHKTLAIPLNPKIGSVWRVTNHPQNMFIIISSNLVVGVGRVYDCLNQSGQVSQRYMADARLYECVIHE